ncbi:chromosome partitioning protein [Micromonospora sp. NPDC048999]|uniref:MinD/ParA family ATP-binding protein n=1 Tax=Micromonospora sp. NPDC048999 TaxID=3155391 RepID=UPI0033D88F9F
MVHENADRAHVPGQPQVPERDIEPPWPPDPTDPAAAGPPWAAPQPAAPVWPAPAATTTPPTTACPPAPPPVDPAAGPAPDRLPPDAGNEIPAPRTAPPPVNLDLPFTLDNPAPGPDGPAPHSSPSGPARPGGEAGTVPPAAEEAEIIPPKLGQTATGGAAGRPADGSDRGGEAAVTAGGRTESPWAQPPQRFTSSASEPAAGPVPPPSAAEPAAQPAAGAASTESVTGGTAGGGGSPERPAPRLGPFPPAPGVPLPPPSYGDGTARPPGPVGYGQPGYPVAQAYPPQVGGPVPPPGWYPPAWPQQGGPAPQQPGPPVPQQPAPAAYPGPVWTPEHGAAPTAEDFARRRQARPADPVATMGVRAVMNRIGLVRLPPGRHEQEVKRDIEMVRRNFGGLRQVTVVNPKGGAGKTVAILLLAMTFGQKRGGYVLAWDNNETQGTLGMRAQQDFHSRTVRDMLRDLGQFQGPHGRVGDLSQYVRSQGEGMFDVLASDESATGGEMLTAAAFAEIREVVSRFYKLIFVDTGNNVRAQNWQAAMDATDQLVVTMSARNDSAETAARMLDHLEQSGRQRLVRQAVTVVSMPPSRKEIDLPAIQAHFAARTRAVLLAPYERLIDTGEPLRYGQLSAATRDAWLKIAAAVAEGL